MPRKSSKLFKNHPKTFENAGNWEYPKVTPAEVTQISVLNLCLKKIGYLEVPEISDLRSQIGRPDVRTSGRLDVLMSGRSGIGSEVTPWRSNL